MKIKADKILPIYRINNRELNLNFFEKTLGMKVLLEEGAMVELGGNHAREVRFLLEESPAEGGISAAGPVKKHGRTILLANASEVESLFQANPGCKAVEYEGTTGFSAFSPEGDEFWLIESELFNDNHADEPGLSDFHVAELTLNVASTGTAQKDLEIFSELEAQAKFALTFSEQAPSKFEDAWDVEALLIHLSEDVDFEKLRGKFAAFTSYLDVKNQLLSVTMPEGIEIWFEKRLS
jgi:hypothetical protein